MNPSRNPMCNECILNTFIRDSMCLGTSILEKKKKPSAKTNHLKAKTGFNARVSNRAESPWMDTKRNDGGIIRVHCDGGLEQKARQSTEGTWRKSDRKTKPYAATIPLFFFFCVLNFPHLADEESKGSAASNHRHS